MPIRVYSCINGHTTEVLEPMDSSDRRLCPECGAEAFRQMAAPNIAADGRYSHKAGKREGAA